MVFEDRSNLSPKVEPGLVGPQGRLEKEQAEENARRPLGYCTEQSEHCELARPGHDRIISGYAVVSGQLSRCQHALTADMLHAQTWYVSAILSRGSDFGVSFA